MSRHSNSSDASRAWHLSANRGFTLIELLLATALTLAAVGVALSAATSARDSGDRDAASGELAQRLRVGAETIVQQVRAAGGGGGLSALVRAAHSLAIVEPLASLDEADARDGAFRALRVTSLVAGAEGLLRHAGPSGGVISLLPPPACPALPGVCGLQPGDVAVLFDRAGMFDVFQVAAINPAGFTITPDRALASVYGAGALVSGVDRATFGLRSDDDGVQRLIKTTAAGATLPIVDHVVAFEVRTFGRAAPPLSGRHELDPPTYGPSPPLLGEDDIREQWGAGEGCTIALDAHGARIPRLVPLGASAEVVTLTAETFSDGPWCPGRAVGANYDADLLRIQRVDIDLRVQVASAQLRGPVSRLYLRPGWGSRSTARVPDGEVHLSIAVRDLAR